MAQEKTPAVVEAGARMDRIKAAQKARAEKNHARRMKLLAGDVSDAMRARLQRFEARYAKRYGGQGSKGRDASQ
jgi:hypothetical protein